MKTFDEIAAPYLQAHDALTSPYYKLKRKGKVSYRVSYQRKNAFNKAHKKIWDDMEAELKAITEEIIGGAE